ncbi:hypothetical protein ACK8HX_01025 [Oryzobacter sp. R7]|uniref:hypothetical protein n=1 Tax=Oryzobacter faecalis TaxID=3388656 RepID=UPI00398C94A5
MTRTVVVVCLLAAALGRVVAGLTASEQLVPEDASSVGVGPGSPGAGPTERRGQSAAGSGQAP